MKLTKKLEAEVLKVYKAYWDAYLNGDMKTFAAMLDDDITVFGTAVSEVFNNKKETLRFYKATADQLVGKAQFRNRKINVNEVDSNVLVNERCDLYFLMDKKWTFYGHVRVSAILKHTKTGWKLVHQHGSFPDMRAEVGEQLAAEKIKAENLQLRDAVKRRTIELENKNRELEIEAAVERVRAKALAMHKSEEIIEVVKTLRNQLLGLNLDGVTAVSICLKQEDGSVRFWDITDLETTGRYSADITFNMVQADPRLYLQKIWRSKKKIIAIEQDANDLKITLKWLSQYDKRTADEIRKLIKINKIKHGWHRAVKLANGRLITDFINEPPVEIESILLKIGAAFDLAYKRFLDLKNAEAQAREARIEAALERVRARTMAMHKSSDLLDVVKVLGEQLELLHVKFDSVNFNTDYLEKDWNLWLYNSGVPMYPDKLHIPYLDHPCFNRPKEAYKEGTDLLSFVFTKEEKDILFDHIYANSIARNAPEERKKYTYAAPGLVWSIAFTKHTSVTISNYYGEPFSEDENAILRRFANVFEQSYTRFLDLQKAEAQAREAEIELALERVRARTMAMQKSDELREAVLVIYEQLKLLHFESSACNIIIIDKESNSAQYWVSGFSQEIFPVSYTVPYFNHPYQDALLKPWKQGDRYVVYEYAGKMKQNFDQIFFTQTDFKNVPAAAKNVMIGLKSVMLSTAFMTYGALQSLGAEPLSDENANILQRFAKVFEQTYTRFLDLQKAEAQAREGQIEAALERVRSRTMGMQKSEELKEVIQVVYEQFVHLNIHVEHTGFIIDYKAKDDMNIWLADKHAVPFQVTIPYFDCAHWNSFKEAKEKGIDFFVNQLSFEEKNRFYQDLFKLIPGVPEETLEYYFSCPGLAISTVLLENVGLYIENFSGTPYTDEENNTLMRFGKVFQQTYTRFLDLKKAEAQTRESQIELGLERVRARAMAMQNSDELAELVSVVFRELTHLDFSLTSCIIWIHDHERSTDTLWIASAEMNELAEPFSVKPFYNDFFKSIIHAWKARDPKWVYKLTGKEKKKFENAFFEEIPELPDALRKALKAPKQVVFSASFNSFGALEIVETEALTDEKFNILHRFGKVFDSSYTRFNDLKNAEAQTREAEIELALERVRAKTMAMQKPSEFVDVITVIGEQFVQLGFDIEWANFGANGLEVANGIDIWNFAVIPGGDPMSARVFIPYFDHPVFIKAVEGLDEYRKTGNDLFKIAFGKKDKDHWLDQFFTKTVFKDVPDEYKAIEYEKPGYTTSNLALKDTWLSIGKFDVKDFTDEQHAILRRFGKAFGQAYTRFLDLQKAEAQAREAQIEAGLERVRSRAMAMQTSEELNELIGTVFTELTKLDLVLTRCVILIYEDNQKGVRWWMANSEAPSTPMNFFVKYADLPFFNEYLKGWHERSLKWQYILEGEDKIRTDDVLFNETELSQLPDFVIAGMKANHRVYLSASFNNYGCLNLASLEPLSDEHFDILLRFAKVFDLTYTRFNDLKQAEAQAREAKIEAALERVRSRAMAMHKTDELLDAAELIYRELSALGVTSMNISYAFVDEKEKSGSYYSVNPVDGKTLPFPFIFPHTETEVMLSLLSSWKKQESFNVIELDEQATLKHQTYIGEHIQKQIAENNPEIPFTLDAFLAISPKKAVIYNFNFTQGYIFIIGNTLLTTEQEQMLLRFTKVFDLTYRRFLDLKQAEAQTREAQIELALERVRARTMAMHRSEELAETAQVLFQQLRELGSIPERISIGLVDEAAGVVNFWTTDQLGTHIDKSFKARLDETTVISKTYQGWKDNKRSLVIDLHGDDVKEWIQFAREEMGIAVKDELIKDRRAHNLAFFSHGWIHVTSHEPQSVETIQILERFASVFSLTYRRFLDLEKAEAQARESELELALERVRAKSMSMRHSDELADLVKIVFKELTRIGFSVNACIIMTYDERTNDSTWWISNFDGISNPVGLFVPNHFNEPYLAYLNEWKKQTTKWRYKLGGAEKMKWDQYLFKNSGLATLPDVVKKGMQSAEEAYLNVCFNKYASITFGSFDPMSDKDFDTLHRFAKVFEQSYTRFLDLQKAEAQVREAQIETALERVRARTMGMHQSKELHDVIETVTNQLLALGLKFDNSVFCRVNEDESWEMWMSTPEQSYPSVIYVPYIDHRIFNNLKEVKAKKLEFYTDVFDQDEARLFFKHFFENTIAKNAPEERKQYVLSRNGMARSLFLTKDIWFVISRYSPDPFNDEENAILKRFAKVFEQSYIRFLDLQKAEAQAHEARIEIALERIRARALAMHKSDELIEVAKVVWEQMTLLGQRELESSVVHLYAVDPDHIHSYRAVSINTDSNTKLTYGHMAIPKNSCEVVREWLAKFHSDLTEYTIEISGQRQQEWYDILFKLAPDVVNSMRQKGDIHEKRFYRFSKFSGGALLMVSKQEPSEEVSYLQKRAAVVFDLAYRRFSDLQKAEAQAREAQIEAAMEKVRASAMAMHNSEHVSEATGVLFSELDKLGIETMRCGIVIIHENQTMETWSATTTDDKKVIRISGLLDMTKHPLLIGGFKGWKNKEESYTYHLAGKDMENYYDFLAESPFYPIPKQRPDMPEHDCTIIYFNEGGLYTFSEKPHGDATIQVLKRFASVFSLTYRRYNDLKNAEAQAREAQIEAALERVRAKAMAMHSSKDLSETLTVFYRELKSLGVTPRRCGIALMDKEERLAEVTTMNTTEQGDSIEVIGQIRMSGHKILDDVYENWRKQNEYHVVLRGNEIKEYYQVLKPQMDFPDYPHDVVQYGYYFMFKEGDVYAWTENELTEDELKIYRRFTSVISLTYKRYKDLQQAEAQAREAQIEAGLERVRARTMAMHSSDDVSIATATMFTELEKLGIESFRGGILNIRADQTMDVWSVNNLAEGKIVKAAGEFDMTMHPFWQQLYKGWVNKDEFLYFNMSGKVKEDYVRILDARRDYLPTGMQELPDSHVQSYYFGEGFVWTFTLQPHSEEAKQVMKRFASVFSLTFRRYQDLKKAEAQAREATIEAALERVRGKAMAMHSSKDLADTIGVFYNELSGLSLTPRRCGVGLINKESRIAEISTMNSTSDGHGIELVGRLDMRGHPVLVGVYDHWLTKTEYHPVLRGNEIKEYYQFVRPQIDFPAYPDDSVQYGYFFFFEEGGVYAWTEKELHEDELKIYRRFTSVLSLTYKRYKDLKDAEARTQTAIKDAALDRIRADIASMRTINDLDRITPLIWNELTVLGIPFIRCGVFIMDEEQQLIHTFLSTPDGKAIAAFHLPYHAPGNLKDVISHWREKRNYISHWSQVDFIGIAETLVEQGAIASKEQYLSSLPRHGFYLHFLPFLQGMLYVGNTEQLKEEEIELIQHVADAFSTAYARYEDFNKLEAAKEQVEKTLADLKQAQTQLVQSEKMASLGELTAGIAHEIQNPLNFVNNFSDVSNELLEEMKNELERGNAVDAMTIVEDIKQNLEKILHHGKRADAIVKGMLQHSRTSSGQKEPTDINMLADEYLRLAFHGLRAKDKSFNAKFETEFDSDIGKINIIPQDIGRVILNLINNAFYAVAERKKQNSNGYEPVVTVVTKAIKPPPAAGGLGVVEIRVKDNGNGIPQKVLDKIFQPFFTTKPTGQGTGLGLSLSYDIVTKGHGGEIKVSTKEGEGSEFVIQLPTN